MKSLGEDTSALKDTGGKAMALMQAIGGMVASDEVIKGAVASYAFEHMEIASYTALIGAARAAGETEVAHVCENILQQEKAMAAWLAKHTPAMVQEYLGRELFGRISKR